ncbi:MAG TPA: hypothetical protein DIW07_11305 [Lachnospiraceae bacterium]|nr:hypothetical protein [Lachnospiraceae bacterium]HCR83974.1 hypothetical protein [Lachnospiraceae bacterium]
MYLTPDKEDILNGGQGELLQKVIETLVRYGEVYSAECLVPLGAPDPHGYVERHSCHFKTIL